MNWLVVVICVNSVVSTWVAVDGGTSHIVVEVVVGVTMNPGPDLGMVENKVL